MKTLTLRSEDLLSKWGFNDGEPPEALLDVLDAEGIAYPTDWHAILVQLVEENLLPVLDQRVEVVTLETNHNPIRADRVDGVELEDWTGAGDIVLSPESVDVPVERVLELVRQQLAGAKG